MEGIYKYRCRRHPGKLSNNYCYTYLTKDQNAPASITIQCSTIVIMLYDVIVVHKNVMVL